MPAEAGDPLPTLAKAGLVIVCGVWAWNDAVRDATKGRTGCSS